MFMPQALTPVLAWLKKNPGIFSFREEGANLELKENFSQKTRLIRAGEVEKLEEKSNSAQPGQTYLVFMFASGKQLALAPQGFVFPPDFTNTGPLPLPSPVYCMQDFNGIFNQLKHVASEPDRKREALDIILFLIALLDGARAAGLDVDDETHAVEAILADLEKGATPPPPHS